MENSCYFCHKAYSCSKSLKRHQISCKQKKIVEQKQLVEQNNQLQNDFKLLQQHVDYLTRENEKQKEKYEKELEIQKELYERELQNDKKKIEKLENQIFEIAKQPKQPMTIYHNKTTHNQKTLNITQQLADYDLDALDIEQQLLESFTEEVFHGGPRKIIELATQLLFTDPETQKPKIICTDLARKNFKYRNPDTGEIEVDPGFQKTHDKVRVPLARANWNIYADKLKSADCYRDTWNCNNSFIGDRTRFADKLLPSLGNVRPGDKNLFENVSES